MGSNLGAFNAQLLVVKCQFPMFLMPLMGLERYLMHINQTQVSVLLWLDCCFGK